MTKLTDKKPWMVLPSPVLVHQGQRLFSGLTVSLILADLENKLLYSLMAHGQLLLKLMMLEALVRVKKASLFIRT
jgi:hypothetical protein